MEEFSVLLMIAIDGIFNAAVKYGTAIGKK